MSGPFTGTGEFKPVAGEKNARESLIEFAERHGWLLDLNARRSDQVWGGVEEQDPNQFVRTALHGGEWYVWLDYEVKGDPDEYRPRRTWDNTLRGLTIWHSSQVTDRGQVIRPLRLNNYLQSNTRPSVLWDLTESDDGKFKPLRRRAEDVLMHPDLLIWCVAEHRHQEKVAIAQQEAEFRELDRQRRQPLPIRVARSEFADMANRLRRTAGDIANADGLADLPELIGQAEEQIAALRSALIPTEEGTQQ